MTATELVLGKVDSARKIARMDTLRERGSYDAHQATQQTAMRHRLAEASPETRDNWVKDVHTFEQNRRVIMAAYQQRYAATRENENLVIDMNHEFAGDPPPSTRRQ